MANRRNASFPTTSKYYFLAANSVMALYNVLFDDTAYINQKTITLEVCGLLCFESFVETVFPLGCVATCDDTDEDSLYTETGTETKASPTRFCSLPGTPSDIDG